MIFSSGFSFFVAKKV